MGETKKHCFLTPNLQRTLDKLMQDEAKTHRTVSRMHCLDANKRLNGLLTDIYKSDKTEIKNQRFLIVDGLYGKSFRDQYDYYNAETLDAFYFCITSMFNYFDEIIKSLPNLIPCNVAAECLAKARNKAIYDTLIKFDEQSFGIEQNKVYIPTIKDPNTREDVLNYLDPDHNYDFSLKNVEKQLEEEQAEIESLQNEDANALYDENGARIPAEAEEYVDEKGRTYYIYDDKIQYPATDEENSLEL